MMKQRAEKLWYAVLMKLWRDIWNIKYDMRAQYKSSRRVMIRKDYAGIVVICDVLNLDLDAFMTDIIENPPRSTKAIRRHLKLVKN